MRAMSDESTIRVLTSNRPLSALLSQVLVAFTIEVDNEFERRMGESGHPGARLSLVVWSNLMRVVAQSEAFVSDPANTLPHYPLWDMNRGFGP
jgi:hypothetical protein